jgi:3-hydroxyacyl-[acyl-carrier-protein] dehydratase
MSDPLAQALSFLPHGPEFRFIDRLLSLDPGNCGAATYQIRGNESFLRGHFPGEPIFPGVLLIEAAAQLAGIVAQSDPSRPPLLGLRLTAVRNAKILGAATPGETLQLSAHITGRLENLVQAQAAVSISSRQVLTTDLVLSGS